MFSKVSLHVPMSLAPPSQPLIGLFHPSSLEIHDTGATPFAFIARQVSQSVFRDRGMDMRAASFELQSINYLLPPSARHRFRIFEAILRLDLLRYSRYSGCCQCGVCMSYQSTIDHSKKSSSVSTLGISLSL